MTEWYPMLATYKNYKGWNKELYINYSESYHTGFSNFTLKYELPSGYTLISSSDVDPQSATSTGKVEVDNVKEISVVVTKEMSAVTKKAGDVEIRVWGREDMKDSKVQVLQMMSAALPSLSQKIGAYPHHQFDVFIDQTASMEYPGLVTVTQYGQSFYYDAVVHELVHQWFYGMVSNDPYYEGWLDEGMTEYTTSLYQNNYTSSTARKLYPVETKPSNSDLTALADGKLSKALYGQPTLKLKELQESLEQEDRWKFIHTYFELYKYKQVTTKEFIRFTKAYFEMKDDSFFKDWLKLD
ncbi:hypothetical protein NV379_12420 [Paenibacillus sp. N1-5-1-14]|uniref:M1 family aminopeptidase n=1 Tax=Paenibacillus radicibacter TaxID=2972488 RepID=UPI0021596EE1|nr:M1 family aminopeptidase [Paenibacillus radicibacter]MCR8643457.1 hypothetical protein [Paenibacillus radicibacter]